MTSPPPTDDLLRRFVDFTATEDDLADLFAAAFQGRLAAVDRKHPGGRPRIDDRAALDEMIGHVELGRSVERAAAIVARAYAGHNVEATARRLARKFRSVKKSAQNY